MNIFFGIRPTSDNLHIGHVFTLFNMFDFIEKNDVNDIYILLAEIHSEISNISIEIINNNAKLLAKKIHSLYYTYLYRNNLNINNINKLKFIFQNNNDIKEFHILLTYKFLPLFNTSKLLKNPIFKLNDNKSIAFLLYPILQSFDVLLYTSNIDDMTVFLGKDQQANVNIMKDIYSKLNINNINFIIYDEIIYDYNGSKMSKSLNNAIYLNDITNISKYILSYKTNINNCELYNNIIKKFSYFLNIDFCEENCKQKKCFNCKNLFIEKMLDIIKFYISNYENCKCIIEIYKENVLDRYSELLIKIENARIRKDEI